MDRHNPIQPRLFIMALLFLFLIASGCKSAVDLPPMLTDTASVPVSTQVPIATATAASLPTRTSPASPSPPLSPTPTPALLPHSLYFLDGVEGAIQVWRLEPDGSTRVQITDEESGVDSFAVSPTDGRLAMISNNQLFLLDGDGTHRQLIADGQAVGEETPDFAFRSTVSDPVFSPDGRTLAYAFDGLHLYDLPNGEDTHVLTNLGNLLGEPFVFAKEIYAPGSWSPDGSKLLVIMGYYEGSTLAVMDLGAAEPFKRLWSNGPVCCLFDWSADGRAVWVSNPYYTVDIPGMWQYDVETGQGEVVAPGILEDGSIDFVGWPVQLPSGDMVYFHVNLERFSPEVGIELNMVQRYPQESHPAQLRPEAFHIIEALWAPGGSFALILQPCCEGERQIILARTDGSPLQVLSEGQRISDLAWGP